MKILQHRTNNAYDSILLVDADTNTVLGAWVAIAQSLADYHADRDNLDSVDQWGETYPDQTSPADYGELVSESEY